MAAELVTSSQVRAGVKRRPVIGSGSLAAALAACAFLTIATPSRAQSPDPIVELHAFDGSAVVKGELVEVSDGSYVLKTALGTLRIGLEDAECRGGSCPRLERFDADFAIQVDSGDLMALMTTLLTGYAETLDAEVQVANIEGGTREVTLTDGNGGKRLAGIDLRVADDQETALDRSDLVVFSGPVLSPTGHDADEPLLALDGAAVIAHPESPIDLLDREAMAAFFTCTRSGVQGLDGPLRLYTPKASSKTYKTFKTTVLDPLGVQFCDRATALDSDVDVANVVTNDPNAIGLVSLTQIGDAKPLPMTECSMIRAPNVFNVKAGDYPLARPILMDAPALEGSSGALQRFIDFALSEDGQRYVEESGYIGLNLDSTGSNAINYLTTRLEAATRSVQNTQLIYQLIEETEDAVRLSTTFRFRSGTNQIDEKNSLDNRAQRDLTRLVRYLESDVGRRFELLLFGFADATGDYDANLALSKQRAQSVADKLAAFGVPITSVVGFGEEAPIACNDNPTGRAMNRRVEVWLRAPQQQASQERYLRIPM